MKQKENIFEELNKMRSLIHTKPGVVISEQIILSERDAVAGTDDDLISISQLLNSPIDTTQKQINSIAPSFSNRKSVIFKSPDNSTYVFFRFKPGGYWNPQNFVLKINGQQKTFGTFDLQNIYFKDPSTAESQWAADSGFNTIVPIASIKGSGTPAAAPAAAGVGDRQKNINNTFCGVRSGKITTGAFKDLPWTKFKTTYSITDAEEQEARKSCPSGRAGASSSRERANIISNYSKEVQTSLGLTPTGKISDVDLDAILKMLEGEEISTEVSQLTQSIPMDANGQPDFDKILASL